MISSESHAVFGSIFGGVGGLVGVFAIYMVINSLEVSRDGNGIKTVRRILGIPIKRSFMRSDAFVKFTRKSSQKSQSGGKHVVYYSIYAADIEDNKIVVGEGFKGESQAKAAMRLIGRELGLASQEFASDLRSSSSVSVAPASR